ncbi:hypothetical protein [Maribacter halichondriae]|uniref:hypothetical protein n=1 Tax=Maribacter halichondriae TaxID=2980554 RepID=UPI0023587B61|nr:hypothetical protein [Maribacter sp. Hal144]
MRPLVKYFLPIFFLCCQGKPENQPHHIYTSIASDSALYYYNLGWKQIMDDGNYGPAEVSYRKVLKHDPDFLIGKSVLGRLTLDLEERLKIFKEVEEGKDKVTGDERLVLDVYHALVEFTNAREQKSSNAASLRERVFKLAENNLRAIVHKYPKEVYMKAEYIEFLHAVHGPEIALDSLIILTSPAQKENPFLLGYSASMNAEVGNFELALQQAKRLQEVIGDSAIPKSYAVLADVYFQMDSLELAKINADRANMLDPRNLDASRLKSKIDALLKE